MEQQDTTPLQNCCAQLRSRSHEAARYCSAPKLIRSTPLHHTPGAMATPEQNAPDPHSCLGQLGLTIQHFVNPASRQQEEPTTKYQKQRRNDRSSETSQLSMW